MLYRFSTPDLTLKTTVELPKPEPFKSRKVIREVLGRQSRLGSPGAG